MGRRPLAAGDLPRAQTLRPAILPFTHSPLATLASFVPQTHQARSCPRAFPLSPGYRPSYPCAALTAFLSGPNRPAFTEVSLTTL